VNVWRKASSHHLYPQYTHSNIHRWKVSMKRRTINDWRKLIQQQAESELSVAEFCKQYGLGQTYFYKRKSDLKKSTETLPKAAFIKINKPHLNSPQSLSIKMQYQQSRINLPVSISPTWFAEFIKALA